MQPFYIYAGTFSPPTYGHFDIINRASQLFPQVHITCGENPRKNDKWFSPSECVELWSTYDLADNVTVSTLENVPLTPEEFHNIVLILGIRNHEDYIYTEQVIRENQRLFGINNFLLMNCSPEVAHISSTLARETALREDIRQLFRLVNPRVAVNLFKKIQQRRLNHAS